MALGFVLQDPATGTAAKVDDNGYAYNAFPQVNQMLGGITPAPASVGGVRMFCEQDAGSVTGVPYLTSPMVSEDRRLQVGLDSPALDYAFNGSAQDTNMWYYAFTTTSLCTQSVGFLVFTGNTATGVGSYMASRRVLPLHGNAGTNIEFVGVITAAFAAGQSFLAGIGSPVNATTAPADGVWFLMTNAGLIGVLAYNGTVTQTGTLVASITPNVNAIFKIVFTQRVVEFWFGTALLGEIAVPSGNGTPFMTNASQVFMQMFNTTAVTSPASVKVSTLHSDLIDIASGKDWTQVQAGKGLMSFQGTQGVIGQTAGYANSTNPTAAAGSNTTANVTGLGGQGAINAAASAATDFIATSYLNPIGGVSQTPRTLYITDLRISSINNGAAVATTPTTLQWGLAFGHTAVSLATTESTTFATATAKAPRRIPLGFQSCPIAAPIGQIYTNDITQQFTTPIVVNPGEYIATFFKQIVGTATASQTIVFSVTFTGYWE